MKSVTRLALALAVAIGIAVPAGSASASQQALVQVNFAWFNPVFFPPSYTVYGYYIWEDGFSRARGTGTATVGTGPTPSVMMPA